MSEPVPEAPAPGFLGHIERWVQEHVAPELATIKADGERLIRFAEAHAANAQSLANVVLTAVKLIDPADAAAAAALIAEAERVAAEADRIAHEILGNA